MTSWGAHLRALVHERPDGARLEVRGRPKGSFLTTKWGEDVHAREVKRQLLADIDRALEG